MAQWLGRALSGAYHLTKANFEHSSAYNNIYTFFVAVKCYNFTIKTGSKTNPKSVIVMMVDLWVAVDSV